MFDGEIEQPTETVGPKYTREVSTIAFPYVDIEDAIEVARALLDAGGVPMDRDQLAAAMGSVPSNGNWNNKQAASRLFGFVEVNQSKYQLTPLGFEVLDTSRERSAMAQAFLNVPLYKRTYDEFRGKQLPPRPLGLEAAFVSFGVSAKQKDKARWAFDKSARVAGYYPNGNEERLVQPVIGPPAVVVQHEAATPLSEEMRSVSPQPRQSQEPERWDATLRPFLHPSIQGMIDDLPSPKSEWSKEEQADWLQAVGQLFRVIYVSDREERILVSVERRRN